MYKIGQKVHITGTSLVGYIVKIEIDPLEEIDVTSESKGWIMYTIRVYKDFYMDGYSDFYRSEGEIENEI